ncbi:MAG: hypothetical protein RIC14_11980 [Filomicrobium sp.]
MQSSIPRTRLCLSHFGIAAAVLFGFTSNASALEPAAKEKGILAECERKLCRQILDKQPVDGSLQCDLEKTWGGKDIKKGAKSKSVSWGFGDAQCSVKLNIKRRHIVNALTKPKYEFTVPRHNVKCTVETDSGLKPLRATLGPKLKFKNGRAKKVWIRLKDIKGPEPLSSFVWTTAKLEDSLGIFHGEMIKQINKFVHRKCEQRYGAHTLAREKRLERIRKNKALRAKRQRQKAARLARLKKQKAKQEKAAAKAARESSNKPAAEAKPAD